MSLSGQKALITGAGGFMAASLADALAPRGCGIVRVARADGDIAQPAFWQAALAGVDTVFHLAAQTSAYEADADPAGDWRANVAPMLALLEACRAGGHRPLILFAGSCTQFGLPQHMPVSEDEPDRPVSVYDRHKIAAEAYLEHYAAKGWARGATLRLANIYGPGPVSGKPDRGVLNLMMRRALAGEALTLYGPGTQMRDYLFVADAAAAFVAAAENGDAVNGRHFVLAGGEGHTLAQAFELVAERAALLTGVRVAVTSIDPPAGLSPIEDRSFVGDSSRLRAATGWAPRTGLSDGIDLTLQSLTAA